MGPSNEPLLYDLSGDTFFTVGQEGSLPDLYTSSSPYSVVSTIKKFEDLVKLQQMVTEFYKPSTSTIEAVEGNCTFNPGGGSGGYFGTCESNRFYILMSQLYINPEFFTTLVNDLTSGTEVKSNPTLVEKIKQRSEDLKTTWFIPILDFYKNKFKTEIEDTQNYKECTTWKIPDNTIKTCKYVYPAVGDLDEKKKKIKDLYSNNNLNDDKTTFNGKVTFN